MAVVIERWFPKDAYGPNENMAIQSEWVDSGDPNPTMPLLLFGGDTYLADFYGVLPFPFVGERFLEIWYRTNAIVGVARWDAAFKAITSDTDLAGKAYDTTIGMNSTVANVFGEVKHEVLPLNDPSDYDSLASGDMFTWRLMLNQAHGSHTLGAYAAFIGAVLWDDEL